MLGAARGGVLVRSDALEEVEVGYELMLLGSRQHFVCVIVGRWPGPICHDDKSVQSLLPDRHA